MTCRQNSTVAGAGARYCSRLIWLAGLHVGIQFTATDALAAPSIAR
jgi:hypothetical protein